ncbi:MAG: hypothetical protein J7527_13650 [Chitinophagaceae bacterium]|nr:hypothetical protein [Chitinophagaceae bacterium]
MKHKQKRSIDVNSVIKALPSHHHGYKNQCEKGAERTWVAIERAKTEQTLRGNEHRYSSMPFRKMPGATFYFLLRTATG